MRKVSTYSDELDRAFVRGCILGAMVTAAGFVLLAVALIAMGAVW